jgi:hypothetical protein
VRADPAPASDTRRDHSGHWARRQIRRTGEPGTALATAGIALGALGIALVLIVLFVLQ